MKILLKKFELERLEASENIKQTLQLLNQQQLRKETRLTGAGMHYQETHQ